LSDILSVSRKHAGVRVTRNTGFLVSGQLVTALFVVLLLGLLGQKLETTGFGLYRLAFKWAMCAGIILDFGSRQFVIREVAKNHKRLGELVLSGLLMRVLFFLPLTAAFAGLAYLSYTLKGTGQDPRYITLLIALACTSISIKVSTDYLLSFFHGLERMEFSAVILPLQSVLVYAASLYAVLVVGAEPHIVFLFDMAAAALVFCITFVVLVLKVPFAFEFPGFAAVWDLVRSCGPFAAIYIFGMLSFWFDTIILSFVIRGDMAGTIGYYESVSALVGYVQRFPPLLAAAVYPVLVRELAAKSQRVESLMQGATKIMLMVSLPMATAWFMLAQPISRFVYQGSEYDAAVPIAVILVWVLPLRFMSHLLVVALNAVHCERINAWISVVTAALAVVLTAVLGHFFGARGAAASVVATSAVMMGSYVYFIRKHLVKRLFGGASLMLIPVCVLLGLTLEFLPTDNLALLIPAGVLVTAAGIFLFRVITWNELQSLLTRLRERTTPETAPPPTE
jgi:O-antigen/teichoic acid export membrane protein